MTTFNLHHLLALAVILLSTTAQLTHAAPEPAITATPIISRELFPLEKRTEDSFHQAVALARLAGRQSKPGMNVCYGTNSICAISNDMSCPSDIDDDEYYRCRCETGYLSVKLASVPLPSFTLVFIRQPHTNNNILVAKIV